MNGTKKGLTSSKWASPSARTISSDYRHLKGSKSQPLLPETRKTSTERKQSAQLQAYARLLKTYRRLKWKSSGLLISHQRALNGNTSNIICNVDFAVTSDTGRANAAEIMFKADFFEYFVLLERCLVHLLECFGMFITADHATNGTPLPPIPNRQENRPPNDRSLNGDSMAFYGYTHRFHANVLAALDKPSNPLHPILGTGNVRLFLGVAKEFRNRWKDIEQEKTDDDLSGLRASYHRILQDLQLDVMLFTILTSLEDARSLASQHLATVHGSLEVEMVNADEQDDAYELPEDVMDWD